MNEALRRGQAPMIRPSKVEVFREGVFLVSAPALKALDKRVLYPPASWPEELDDRTKVTGRLRLTFADTFPGGGFGVLELRVLVKKAIPVCALHGPVFLLGHHATDPPQPGWHPALLPLGPLPTTPLITQIHLDTAVSRALISRNSGVPGTSPGGI
ncbi:hypothetical protein GO986_09085 [Deinococcus sp. HMF7620]|uniref:Uncharacterized protein n=1 Tax=Deinococcus arboris TaxID=2682977 RepID=A0A7C9LKS4_9DEIO|nr:hypothetical protein [Deinococcus arboris]MVN86918.1 hypothetical protein [Deinococcus arboris]